MPAMTSMPDRILLLGRLSLGWLTASSLMAVMVGVTLFQGRDLEIIDPIYYLLLLGPLGGWAGYFRGRLGGVFLWGLPSIGLGSIVLGVQILPVLIRWA